MTNPLLKLLKFYITPFQLNWVAAAAAVYQGVSAKSAAKKAAAGQAAAAAGQREASDASLAESQRQYDTGQANLAPYQAAGQRGLGQYEHQLARTSPTALSQFGGQYQGPGAFAGRMDTPSFGGVDPNIDVAKDPGYQFRKEQGLEALDRMMAKGGKRFSGERGIALQQYGQGLASQEYGAAYGRGERAYGRAETAYNRQYGAASDTYNRGLQRYGMETDRAGGAYQRSLGEYGLQYGREQDIERQRLNTLGQYAGLAASGQQAAGAASNLGASYANSAANIRGGAADAIGRAQVGAGQARAAGTLGVGNAITSGLAAYNYNQGYGGQSNYSGMEGVNRGSEQDRMLAEQNEGFYD